jgi:ectoine hydroxylase-related dioxygenase (phytanoyl-CoA dioxygenase family)
MGRALLHLAADAPTDDIVERLKADGGVIVDGLLDPGLLDRFNAELDPLVDAARADRGGEFINRAVADFFGGRTRHVTGVAGKSRVFAAEVMTHPTLLAVANTVLRESCSSIQLNLGHVLDRGPGAKQQLLHRDELIWPHLPVPHGEVMLASLLALVDFTAENGATVLAPGSHRWRRDQVATPDDLVAAEMPAGSAVIYLGSTIHAAGSNSTADQWRRGMHLSYAAGWLRTEENHCLSVPAAVARELPREAQVLLGYGAHDAIDVGGGYLGMVDLRDPVELLAEGRL